MSGSVFSPKDRESLIGHLVGLDTDSLVLTPRQRLALEEENRLNQGLFSFGNLVQQPQAGFLNKQFNLERGRQGTRLQNVASLQNNEIFNSKQPFKRPAIQFWKMRYQKTDFQSQFFLI